jgi:hypothetical protein
MRIVIMLHNEDEVELVIEPSPALPMESIILMSKHVSYKHGLAALSQTSKGNNSAVEDSDVGQLARYAHYLEPNARRASFADFVDRCIGKYKINIGIWNLSAFCTGPAAGMAFGTAIYGVPGAYIGGAIGVITAFASYNDSYLRPGIKYFLGASSMLALPFSASYLASDFSPAYCALSGTSNLAIMSIFANRNNVETSRREIKDIRKQLAKPFEYVSHNKPRV